MLISNICIAQVGVCFSERFLLASSETAALDGYARFDLVAGDVCKKRAAFYKAVFFELKLYSRWKLFVFQSDQV